jgi:hypothetical protein
MCSLFILLKVVQVNFFSALVLYAFCSYFFKANDTWNIILQIMGLLTKHTTRIHNTIHNGQILQHTGPGSELQVNTILTF